MLTATTVARLALGVARGVTAVTLHSMEGIRTGHGIKLPLAGLRAPLSRSLKAEASIQTPLLFC
jgi:hypothetical protein